MLKLAKTQKRKYVGEVEIKYILTQNMQKYSDSLSVSK